MPGNHGFFQEAEAVSDVVVPGQVSHRHSAPVTARQSRRHFQRQNQEENAVFIVLRRLEEVLSWSSQVHPGD